MTTPFPPMNVTRTPAPQTRSPLNNVQPMQFGKHRASQGRHAAQSQGNPDYVGKRAKPGRHAAQSSIPQSTVGAPAKQGPMHGPPTALAHYTATHGVRGGTVKPNLPQATVGRSPTSHAKPTPVDNKQNKNSRGRRLLQHAQTAHGHIKSLPKGRNIGEILKSVESKG